MTAPVYFDHAATTPLDEDVAKAMLAHMVENFGNPSSAHAFGRKARQAVARAREQVAGLLRARPQEIFFTSGGSESDNWALKGLALAHRHRGNHIITTSIEHHAVLRTCQWLGQQGFAVTFLPVDGEGMVSAGDVERAIRPETILISVMAANNEVGTLEPWESIGEIARQRGILFHTDAVQAAGHIPLDMRSAPVDALSLSGHKFYGPKGVGALYLREGTPIVPLLHGGAQERDLRAGTENTAGIVGLGLAAEKAAHELAKEHGRLCALRDYLMKGICALDGGWVNGSMKRRLPGNVNFGIAGIAGDVLLIRLDLAGFALSNGSACSAGSPEPSHVLLAMGQPPQKAAAALRLTLGRGNTLEEADAFLAALQDAAKEITGPSAQGRG